MRSLLKGITGGASRGARVVELAGADVISPEDAARRLQVLDEFEQAGIGWIWATDA